MYGLTPSAFVGVQKLVDPVVVVGRGLDDFAVFDLEDDIFIGKALFLRRRVVGHDAVHGLLDRSGVDFAVRDVAFAGAFDGRDVLDGEGQVCAGAFDLDFVRAIHEIHQGVHGMIHLAVIQCADVEIEVLKGFQAGVGQLCHRVVRVAENDPFCLVDPVVKRRAGEPVVHVQLVGRHVGKLSRIAACSNRDVSLHTLHLLQTAFVHKPDLLLGAVQQDLAGNGAVADIHIRQPSLSVNLLDKLPDQVFAAVALVIDEHFIASLHVAGIIDQQVGQFDDSWIHK